MISGTERVGTEDRAIIDVRHGNGCVTDAGARAGLAADQVLDRLGHGVLVVDVDTLRIGYANDAACRLAGRPLRTVPATHLWQLTPALDAGTWGELFCRLLAGELDGHELRLVFGSGPDHLGPVACRLEEPRRGDAREVVLSLTDLSARLLDEERVREASRLAERDRIATELRETVIHDLFATGLALQAVAVRLDPVDQGRVNGAVESLDDVIRTIRRVIFRRGRGRVG